MELFRVWAFEPIFFCVGFFSDQLLGMQYSKGYWGVISGLFSVIIILTFKA
jgi:hypothetical protein